MSFEPPAGILDIGNATLRVGKLEVAETSGLNQGLQNIVKNDLLITETAEYTTNQTWGLKLPTAWVADFDIKGGTGKYVEFNFYNEGSTSNAQGYTLHFEDTTLTLKYDNGSTLASATIPTIVGTYRKVNIFFERNVVAVSIDGTRYLYDKRPSVLSRVISTTGSAFLNTFFESDHGGNSGFKNLRIVNGRFISDKTSNVSFIGSLGVGVNSPTESLDVLGNIKTRANVHVTGNVHAGGEIELYSNLNIQQVSNTATIKATSNVVTEFPRSKKFIKYPRVALTSASQDAYVVTESSEFSTTSWQSYYAFDNNTADGSNNNWASLPGRYTSSGQTYSGGSSLGNYDGEYIQIELPVKINLSLVRIFPRTYATPSAQTPNDFVIIASNDGVTYDLLKSVTNQSDSGTWINIDIHTTNLYNRFALVISKVISSDTAGIAEIEYHGLPEYDPDAHGTDVVVKSVPNVPNTDWLEVYYDAKEPSSYPGTGGTVLDLSGNQINGTLNGGVGFDSTYKAFTFDEADDYITLDTGKTGNYVFSVSLWFKSSGNSIETLFHMNGDYATNNTVWLYGSGTNLYISFINNSYTCDTGKEIADNMWHHTSFVYNGNGESGRDIYLDGVRLSGSVSGSSAGSDLNLTSTSSISRIGALNYTSGIIHKFKGSIANFRLFNRALTSDEVWQLYAYQKEYFGHGDLSMTLKAGRLGIGTSEPKVALDVRGGIAGPFTTFLTGDVTTSIVTAAASTSIIYPVTSYTFDVPSEYHAFGTKNLEIYGQIKWCGEIDNPWNAMFSARLYYGSGLTSYVNSAENTTSNANTRNNGAGVPSTNATNDDFISTLEACILSSRFYIPNCPVSNGSQLKLELRFRQGNASSSVYTNRTKNDLTNDVNYERGTTNFFLAVK